MKHLIFTQFAKDIEDFLIEYEDDFDESFEDYDKMMSENDYPKLFDEIECIFYSTYKHDEVTPRIFGNLNMYLYLYNFNREFLTFLSKRFQEKQNKWCLPYVKYLEFLISPDNTLVEMEQIYNVLSESEDKKIEITYKDKSDKLTVRIISDIDMILDYNVMYSVVNAHCHLRDDARKFTLKNIKNARFVE